VVDGVVVWRGIALGGASGHKKGVFQSLPSAHKHTRAGLCGQFQLAELTCGTGYVRGCAGGPVFTCRFRPSSAIHRLGGKPGVAGAWGEANNGQTDKDWLTLSPGGTIVTADKRRAIRTVLARLGMQGKPQEVVETLESYGVSVGPQLVRSVKLQILRDDAKAARERVKLPPKPGTGKRPQQRKIPPRRR